MHRRTFLELTGMGLLALGCGGLPGSSAGSGKDPASFALLDRVPGFQDVGAYSGSGPAPVLVQLTLNINDFMRPQLEAAAVSRWLSWARELKLSPMELDFTGHELQAFLDQVPSVIEEIRAQRPTIREHYRMLEDKHLLSTTREMYYTEPRTLELDRSRYGPCLLIQKTFGVTPRDEGGNLGALLRQAWKQGTESRELRALGFDKLDRRSQVGHPDRIVAWCLPDIDPADGREHIEVFLRIRRLERAMLDGKALDPAGLEAGLTDLKRWAQVTKEMGFDLNAVPELSGLIDHEVLPDFGVGVIGIELSGSESSAFRQKLGADPEGARSAMEAAMRGLAERTGSLPTIRDELEFKLSRLPPDRVHVTRLAWHASNDHTQEAWGELMFGGKGTKPPYPLTPASERPADQQAAIQAAARSILEVIAGDPRCRVASLDNDSQWASENSAAAGYQAVFGLDFAQVPQALDPDQVDAMAAAQGLGGGKSGGGQGGGQGGGGKAGKSGGGGGGGKSGKTGKSGGGGGGGRPPRGG